MLFRITRDCSMNCSHCLINAEENGLHMVMDTAITAIAFMKMLDVRVVMVTGGEPFGHPEIFEIIRLILHAGFHKEQVLITSNGLPLQDEVFLERALSYGVGIQVVNDPKYYPRRVVIPGNKIEVIDYVGAPIFPAGRALTNGLECTAKAPSCFNLRSIARQNIYNPGLPGALTLRDVVSDLENRGRFCTPVIDYEGSIKIGEHATCKPVGTIWTPHQELYHNIRSFKCNACKLFDNLTPVYKNAAGEMWEETPS